MGRIKSALELALERTESVQSDRASIELYEAKQQGLKLAGRFMEDSSLNLEAEVKKADAKLREALSGGVIEGLLARMVLPYLPEEVKILETVGKGLTAVRRDSQFAALYKNFLRHMAQFPEEYKQYDKAIRQQYAPALRQKEEALSQQLGQQVRLDPMQDPEFAQFYKQNMDGLRAQYEGIIAQVKEAALQG